MAWAIPYKIPATLSDGTPYNHPNGTPYMRRNYKPFRVSTYAMALALLQTRGGKTAHHRKLTYATYLAVHPDGWLCITHHGTVLVAYHPDGTVYIRPYATFTSRQRINRYSPVVLYKAGKKFTCRDFAIDGVPSTETGTPCAWSHPTKRTSHAVIRSWDLCLWPKGHYSHDLSAWVYDFEPRRSPSRIWKCSVCHGTGVTITTGYADDMSAVTTQHQCYNCKGAGRKEHGQRILPVTIKSYSAYIVSAAGQVLHDTDPLLSVDVPHTKTKYGTDAYPHWGFNKKWLSAGSESAPGWSNVVNILAAALPDLYTLLACPCCTNEMSVSNAIIHLNDNSGWSREHIADWLETLDLDLSFKEKEVSNT